jgi:hypothetical protein
MTLPLTLTLTFTLQDTKQDQLLKAHSEQLRLLQEQQAKQDATHQQRMQQQSQQITQSFQLQHGARFPTEIYTRGCHWIPRMFA